MTYKEAIELAKRKDEAGYQFLYESTYRDKYYIALKYMQNEADALDVLHDSYIAVFGKLDSLNDAEKFPAWLGVTVANTAKNALKKKKPVLFSEMQTETEDGAVFEHQIEDVSIENQPELAYTTEETKELVQQLLDSLSEEQRMCMLMFYMEEMSIREIAEILDCSENTVKSRLNYGRKNMKVKAEELQKKGYKLYGVAPMPLLLYLLRAENTAFLPAPEIGQLLGFNSFMECFRGMTGFAQQAGNKLAVEQSVSAGGKLTEQVAGMAGKAAKQTFFQSLAGQITVAAVTVVAVTAIATTLIKDTFNENKEIVITATRETNTQAVSEDVTEPVTTTEQLPTEEVPAENTEYKQAYLEILQGKEEMIRLYDYQFSSFDENAPEESLPVSITDATGDDVPELILLCRNKKDDLSEEINIEIYSLGDDKKAKLVFTQSWELLAGGGFSNFLFKSEGSNSLYWCHSYGDEYHRKIYTELVPDDSGMLQANEILNFYEHSYEDRSEYLVRGENVTKDVYLDNENSLLGRMTSLCLFNHSEAQEYRIGSIQQEYMTYEEALRFLGDDVKDEEIQKDNAGQENATDWKSAYMEAISSPDSWLRVQPNIDTYLLDGATDYQYSLFDMNQDGTPELLMKAQMKDGFVAWYFCTYSQSSGAYMIACEDWNPQHYITVYDNQLALYSYGVNKGQMEVYINILEMTPMEITNTHNGYSGIPENAPDTEQLMFYPITDTDYFNHYE